MISVPVEVSNRHLHVSSEDLKILFGSAAVLHSRRSISQTGQFAAEEVVRLVGLTGTIERVRIVGPERSATQVEISASDAKVLGVSPPLRDSGELEGSAGLTVEGPAGRVVLSSGVIRQRRHIHATEADCRTHGVQPGAIVRVRVNGYVFDNVFVKVHPSFVWRLHLDTDEARLAHIQESVVGEVMV